MAQLHRDTGRPRYRHAQLWRPAGLHLCLPLYGGRHGRHDLRADNVPLASAVYTAEGPGGFR